MRGFGLPLLLHLLMLAGLSAAPARAGTITSTEIIATSVTLYGNPNQQGEINRADPQGYALITETRRISLPAGESMIRFEGVAEGMFPETAIITGLPQGVREKNRDARLISPAGLVDAYLRRKVQLRRTNRQTGRAVEQDAILRAGPYGGIVLETAEGVEALGCAGLPERMLFDGVPEGLAAKPTLSVLATSERAVTATVQISYIAQGFDWTTSYIAELAEDGRTLTLFAWVTIASGDSQSFVNANTQAVAGKPNKESHDDPPPAPSPELELRCWPLDTTSTHPRQYLYRAPPPPSAAYDDAEDSNAIIVTAQRMSPAFAAAPIAVTALQEELGDLKLYRIPEPVTVAAKSQKQVAMFRKEGVSFERIYTATVSKNPFFGYSRRGAADDQRATDSNAMDSLLRLKNVKAKGLGLPLPAGQVSLFEFVGGTRLLVGEDDVKDRAIGEDVEFVVGESPDVRIAVSSLDTNKGFRARLTNARNQPVTAEVRIASELAGKPKGLVRKNGRWLWRTTVPANGEAKLEYRLKAAR